jgi:hypothetical protein
MGLLRSEPALAVKLLWNFIQEFTGRLREMPPELLLGGEALPEMAAGQSDAEWRSSGRDTEHPLGHDAPVSIAPPSTEDEEIVVDDLEEQYGLDEESGSQAPLSSQSESREGSWETSDFDDDGEELDDEGASESSGVTFRSRGEEVGPNDGASEDVTPPSGELVFEEDRLQSLRERLRRKKEQERRESLADPASDTEEVSAEETASEEPPARQRLVVGEVDDEEDEVPDRKSRSYWEEETRGGSDRKLSIPGDLEDEDEHESRKTLSFDSDDEDLAALRETAILSGDPEEMRALRDRPTGESHERGEADSDSEGSEPDEEDLRSTVQLDWGEEADLSYTDDPIAGDEGAAESSDPYDMGATRPGGVASPDEDDSASPAPADDAHLATQRLAPLSPDDDLESSDDAHQAPDEAPSSADASPGGTDRSSAPKSKPKGASSQRRQHRFRPSGARSADEEAQPPEGAPESSEPDAQRGAPPRDKKRSSSVIGRAISGEATVSRGESSTSDRKKKKKRTDRGREAPSQQVFRKKGSGSDDRAPSTSSSPKIEVDASLSEDSERPPSPDEPQTDRHES